MHTDQGSGLGGGSLRAPGTASEAGGADQPPDSFSVITDGVTRSALGDGSTMMVAGDGETPIGDALPRGERRDRPEIDQADKRVWMDFEDFCKCFK